MYLGSGGEGADADEIAAERPDLVVSNGYANQYDHDPLTARIGERVRVWVLAAGPQRGSAFNVVGGQSTPCGRRARTGCVADLMPRAARRSSAWPPAQGGFVGLTFPQAGRYPFVTHPMVDAERGAHGVVEVTGR